MRFLMMVKASERSEAGVMPTENELSEMGAYNEQLIKAGVMLAGDGLQASSKGSRVRITGGKATTVDGPFAETNELLGGFWVIQVKSKAEAVEWARRVPFREGAVELRELFETSDFPVDESEKPGGWRDKELSFREAAAQEAPVAPARKPGTRRYMVFLKADQFTESEAVPPPELMAKMGALMGEMVQKGALLAGDGLKPSKKGARITYSGEKRSVVDGPFTESKELLAGYSIIQVATHAEAVEFGRRMLSIHMEGSGAPAGEIEVRPMFELEDFPVSPAEKPGGWRDQEMGLRDRAN